MKDTEYYNDYLEIFSNRLIALRMKKGFSAREMSLSIGLTPSYIGKIESRHSFPSMIGFYYICDFLGIAPSEFFDDGNEHPKMLSALIDVAKKLDEKQLTTVAH